MQHADRPIVSPRYDVLGRSRFALRLARSIDHLGVAADGFVLAILGDWGSGKTSVVELLIYYLRHLEMQRTSEEPLLGEEEAAPKSLQDLDEMAQEFERVAVRVAELEAFDRNAGFWDATYRRQEFRGWLGSENAVDLAHRYWRLKRRTDARPRTIVVRFSPWLMPSRAELTSAFMAELARALGPKLGPDVSQAFASILRRISEFTPIVGAGLDFAGGMAFTRVFSAGSTLAQRISTRLASGPTLTEVRERLHRVLLSMNDQQILVIIDDLDRLTPIEATEMVSLVKSLGSLPNVIYVLSYAEGMLAELIHKALGIDGRTFLEKIVQYPVHLPPIGESDIERLLESDLALLLGTLTPDDRHRLSSAWYFVLRSYLRTPRDVRRFINSLTVALSGLADYIDPIDMVVLEALRLYEPEVYWWIRENLGDLTE
jgi:predicted KAP-like P-loop ATPase